MRKKEMFTTSHPLSMTDKDFDALYPDDIRCHSFVHWSSLKAVQTAVDFFSALLSPDAQILDVGSGAGKFCLYGSMISSFNFTGIEKRKNLHAAAQKFSTKISSEKILFLCGDALFIDWNDFDGIYLYNPFYEYKLPTLSELLIDTQVEHSVEKFDSYARKAHKKLKLLKIGACVVLLNGFGANMPHEFVQKFFKKVDGIEIALWQKQQ